MDIITLKSYQCIMYEKYYLSVALLLSASNFSNLLFGNIRLS